MQVLTPRGRRALLLLAALALPARALDFGEIEVLSAIGEKLDARIPLKAGAGEWFHVTCLSLSGGAGASGIPSLADGVVSVERRSRSTNLRVRSASPVNEPVVGFSVISTCADGSPTSSRQFSALLDLPRVDRAPRMREVAASAAGGRTDAPATRRTAQATPAEPPQAAKRAATAPAASAGSTASRDPAPPATPRTPSPVPVPRPAVRSRSPDFVLRLSSDPIDTSRSRTFDDKSRAVLRERLRLLDNDDQVAAMLALRDNMQRLEARVAELQLKLAAAPSAIPPPRPAPQVAAAPAPVVPAPASRVEAAPRIEPPKVEAPKIGPPKAVPSPSPAPAPAVAAKSAAPQPAPAPATAPAYEEESLPGGLWPWLAGLALLVLLVGAWMWKRRAATREEAPLEADEPATVFARTSEALEAESPIEIAPPLHSQTHAMPAAAPVAAPARAPEDPVEALRRRYIEERFPEIRDRTIVLDDPGSVVKGARLFYEDGSLPRAVELLRFATEDRPDAIRPWLALFEIYRLERLTGEYADLAGRFGARHGGSDKWEKVRAFGREIDPGNPAYAEAPVDALATIGPSEARRRAQAHADPIAENWLEAPMDFENEVVATELRRALMARASVEERDLTPNPMPALRSVEMFSVG